MTAPTTTTPEPTAAHAGTDAVLLPAANGIVQVDFPAALVRANMHPLPRVIQQRYLTDPAMVRQTFWIVDQPSDWRDDAPATGYVRVRIWDDYRQSWSDDTMDLHVETMGGDRYVAVDPIQPTPPPPLLPRTAAAALDAAAMLDRFAPGHINAVKLAELARWLPGGELMTLGHDHARNADLCGEYETAVCPALGWEPRRGMSSRPAALIAHWERELAALEQNHAGDVGAALDALLDRYADGGAVNVAVVDHATNHLEQHKRDGVNALLSDVLGWSYLIPTSREYAVEVEVTRTFTARQTVTVYITAESEDDISDCIDSAMVADAVCDDSWDIEYEGTSRYDVDDWSVEDVNET